VLAAASTSAIAVQPPRLIEAQTKKTSDSNFVFIRVLLYCYGRRADA